MLTITIIFPATLLLVHPFISLVSLYPFNNVRNYAIKERLAECSVNGSLMVIPPGEFSFHIAWMIIAALLIYPVLLSGEYLSRQHYCFGLTEAWQKTCNRLFKKTFIVLPFAQNPPGSQPGTSYLTWPDAACCYCNIHYLFYGSLRTKAFYTNIHLLLITGGLLLNLLLAVVYQYINAGSPFLEWRDLPGFYMQGWPIMLQTFVILYVVYYSICYFNKKYSYNPNGFERFLREILFVLLIGFCIMEFFRWIFVTYMVFPEDDMNFLERKLKMILTIDITFLIVVYATMTSFRIFRYLQQKNIEVARWQKEYAQSQFEAVKNQLNPHFLFNSLNALSSLVYVDADLAESFIEKLSRSYRYLLEQRDKQTVLLEQELQFLESFLFLMEQRFGRKLQVHVEKIDADSDTVPPHTLLIVMEHILQNNTMSNAKPLRISITKEDSLLCIRYPHQPKEQAEEKSAQFNYLQEQFRYLNETGISTSQKEGTIQMTIPLLKR